MCSPESHLWVWSIKEEHFAFQNIFCILQALVTSTCKIQQSHPFTRNMWGQTQAKLLFLHSNRQSLFSFHVLTLSVKVWHCLQLISTISTWKQSPSLPSFFFTLLSPSFFCTFIFIFETRAQYVAQAGLKLSTLLP